MEMKTVISKVKAVAVKPTNGRDEDGYVRDVVIFTESGSLVLELHGMIRQDVQVGFGKRQQGNTGWKRPAKEQLLG